MFGFVAVASATPKVEIANPEKNAEYILSELRKPRLRDVDLVVLPELALSGYTCGDLFFQETLVNGCLEALETLCDSLKNDNRLIAVGVPLIHQGKLYNCAAVICRGKILGVVPKSHIPNYQEFYEKRWFFSGKEIKNQRITIGNREVPFGTDLIFLHNGVLTGIEICEDLWVPTPPSTTLCENGAEIILNLSATDDNIGKYGYIKNLVASQSSRCRCAYAYASAGDGESSTDLVFSGINLVAYNGEIIAESSRFSTESSQATAIVDIEKIRNERRKYSTFFSTPDVQPSSEFRIVDSGSHRISGLLPEFSVNPHPFVPSNEKERDENCKEIVRIQSWGLRQRLQSIGCKSVVIGISGGLDSTLSLLVAARTFASMGLPPTGIIAVTMPADATSSRTLDNAVKLMEAIGATILQIPIMKAVNLHFQDIGHDPEKHDAVYENSQARERTQILMDLANKYNGIVLGTGDMSELALGWCTYNGDQISMYNVNAGVPKTLVKYIVKWFADNAESNRLGDVLLDILDTPISPELIPAASDREIAQKTEDIIGPYELHDFFLFHVIRNGFTPAKILFLASKAFEGKYEVAVLKKWLLNFYRRFFSQQFKRSCMPDGPKIGSVCLSPRGDWRMPSDASAALWLKEAERLNVEGDVAYTEEDLKSALRVLNKGGIILYPTDTVWGLGCDASNEEAVRKLFSLKKRLSSKAMISLVDSVDSLHKWVENVPEEAMREIESSERPLTVIYDSPVDISARLKASDGSAAFRITSHPFTKELCRRLGRPLVSTSANMAGEMAPATFNEIDESLRSAVDYVCLTGREKGNSKPSRIIKITDDGKVTVIRE